LPPQGVQAITGGKPITPATFSAAGKASARKRLLTLPAVAPLAITGNASTSAASMSTWLILVLAAIAVALSGTAVARRRSLANTSTSPNDTSPPEPPAGESSV
jgi:hypothetical protein